MILILKKITQKQKDELINVLKKDDCMIKEIVGFEDTILGVVRKVKRNLRYFETFEGVTKVIPISKPYKLVSRDLYSELSVIMVNDVAVGGDRLVSDTYN